MSVNAALHLGSGQLDASAGANPHWLVEILVVIQWQCDRVLLHCKLVDFRKPIYGLSAIMEQALEQDVFGGQVFAFCNKHCNKIKVLYGDKTGFALWYKRLEKQRAH